jgi:hypothetical protein
MHVSRKLLPIALLAVPVAAMAGDPPCKNVTFGSAVLTAFPNAMQACHGVKVKDNVVYAHFMGEVQSASSDEVAVIFEDYEGKDLARIKFAPGNAAAKIDGQTVPYAKMKEGTKLDFYIPQDKWGLYGDPSGFEMKIVSREDL